VIAVSRFGIVLVTVLALVGCERAGSKPPTGKLERVTVGPREARRSVGESQYFTVTGHYTGGEKRNLTQKVEYTSSDPAIARASNAQGDRSRIEALAPGTVTITVVEPKTGVRSDASNDDATFHVLGALERIVLTPERTKRRVGDTPHLTATGHYAGGTVRNLTQKVEYRSSDPAVVAAPNAADDKSKLEVRAAGSATISARDPATGIDSSASGGDAKIDVLPPS
jgi:uncharacterized protein YjdB